MSRFSNNWSGKKQPNKSGLSKKFRSTINPKPQLKPTMERAVKSIQNQLFKLDILINKLSDKDKKLVNRITARIQKHDDKHAIILANELVEIRKMMKVVTQAKYALEAIVMRIETVTELGDIVSTLAPAVSAVKSVQKGVIGVVPTAQDKFTEISGMLSDILVDAGQSGQATLDFKIANEDAEKIIAEASIQAETKLKKKIPEIPPSIPKHVTNVLKEALA
jgi:division protein CdvB (Snf7/Vps24/ESCRT-III family)|tara:strand:+ start:6713 stop:7375 length:663 start_codon:yes stop_codon:yes gene_type:complete